jgi:hypothetical protein
LRINNDNSTVSINNNKNNQTSSSLSSLINVYSSRTVSEEILGQQRSDKFWKNLCIAMCPEIQIYYQILHRSDNLSPSQIQESIQEVVELCPPEHVKEKRIMSGTPSTRTCPGIPQFPPMPVPRRQYQTEVKKRLFTVA